jgi:ATP-dependent RNA helicase SUPV3L1/SUV3
MKVQLAADPERGHVFTDRILHARGYQETLLLGAETIRRVLESLYPGIEILIRKRMSRLNWSGQKKVTRLPRRSAVVVFSIAEVYQLAELIRRQRGGTAIVMGALSPRTRNAQVEMFQSGEVDYMVATDAIGMGLNMDIDHVAIAGSAKFDGRRTRGLSAAELGTDRWPGWSSYQRRYFWHNRYLPDVRRRSDCRHRRSPVSVP